MEYPKALYKGERYTEWSDFCRDLELKKIAMVIVGDAETESHMRAEGFTDAKDLMEPAKEEAPVFEEPQKRRGMPKGGWPKKDVNG